MLLLTQPALTLKEGRVIKDGFNPDLDELRSLATNSEQWLAKMEADIKEATGLSKIKLVIIRYLDITLKYPIVNLNKYLITLFENKL